MLSTYPSAWLLLGLPFVSSMVLGSLPWLWALATTMNQLTRAIGTLGLAALFAGLLGLLPAPYALPVAVLGGAVSGYAMFSLRDIGNGTDGNGWRRLGPPPDEPPPPPLADGPIDWQVFDRLRTQWERRPVTHC
jgi:hypothetical protein